MDVGVTSGSGNLWHLLKMKIGNVVQGLKPMMLMVAVQVSYVGANVLYKLAINDGMSLRVVIAYRYVFATASIAPLALILERLIQSSINKIIWEKSFEERVFSLLVVEKWEAIAILKHPIT